MIKHCHKAQAGLEIDFSLLRKAEWRKAGGHGGCLVPPTGHWWDYRAIALGVDRALPPASEQARTAAPPTLQGRG